MASAYFGEAGPHQPAGFGIIASQPLAKALDEEGFTVSRIPSVKDTVDDTGDVDSA